MPKRKRHDAKAEVLRKQGALNAHPESVEEPLFRDSPFFDPRDLVQLRYEMLRAVSKDGRVVSEVAGQFGCSRPTYYKALDDFDEKGLVGLLPKKRGPRGGHKLSGEVLDFVEAQLQGDSSLLGEELADRVRRRFGVEVHASSVRRALSRREKRGG
jgi:transposase